MSSEGATPSSLTVGAVREFYDSEVVIDTFNRGFGGRWHTRIDLDLPGGETLEDYVTATLDLGPTRRVLDFGCGVGATTCRFAARYGGEVRGLNISAPQIGIATELARRLGLADRVKFDLYPGHELPYPDRQFDRAVFFESVCHVPHKRELFAELFRVLRPGGLLAGQDWMLARDGLSAEEHRRWIQPIEDAIEVRLLSVDGYRRGLEEAGFTNVLALDARSVANRLEREFPHDGREPIEIPASASLADRLHLGHLALSAAFRRGLFTVGFVSAERPARPAPALARLDAIVAPEETPLSAYDRSKNVAVLADHRARHRLDGPAMAALAHLAAEVSPCTIETSVKLERGVPQRGRVNLFYHGTRRAEFLDGALAALDRIAAAEGVTVDTGRIRRFVEPGVDFEGVDKIVIGVDRREDEARSRLKLWLMIGREEALVERALAESPDRRLVEALRFHEPFLLGFDLRYDGSTALKLYPDVTAADLSEPSVRERLARHLRPAALAAMEGCSWTHLYLAAHNPEIVLQLHPREPIAFLERHVPQALPLVGMLARGPWLDFVVSTAASGLERPEIESAAVYTMPARSPVVGS